MIDIINETAQFKISHFLCEIILQISVDNYIATAGKNYSSSLTDVSIVLEPNDGKHFLSL